MSPGIDLNCDLGESPERSRDGTNLALLRCVSSANIACGGHAGDGHTMRETVRNAMSLGVAIGAHPGYPDRANFGRVEVAISPRALEDSVAEQIGSLRDIARSLGARLTHVKPHGALYHAAMMRAEVAESIARAAGAGQSDLILVGLAGAPGLRVWKDLGFRVAAEAFVDRAYEADGSLRARSRPGALIDDPATAAAQAVRIARGLGAQTPDGRIVALHAQTICIHSDTPGAPEVAAAVRRGLESAGIAIRGLSGFTG
jgi:UPF0271 protein